MNVSDKRLIVFLRITSIVLLSAAGAVVMPTSWMHSIHEALGLGELPDLPMMGYLTRSLSGVYACLGAFCWYLSRDVGRYLPLLRFAVPTTLVFDLGLIAIDVSVGMPIWWTAIEGLFVLGWTGMLWAHVRGASAEL